jgi:TonB-linked SusC/RagA family outer membrane protein
MGKNYFKKYLLLCVLLTMSVMAFAQTGSITGKVVDNNNETLPGASVSVNGTTLGATADANGVYRITGIVAGTYTVTARFIGYNALQQTITLTAGQSVTFNFTLQPESRALNEIVVIGYGTTQKKDLTGSVATVTTRDFQKGVITSPEQLIAGKVAGVSILSNGGAPGAGSTIRIRGGASLNSSNDPLLVIDGVPVSNSGVAGSANVLSLINPNDIESFSILKDASAAAIYGNRASNGVILITTKKGQSGAPQINFFSQNSLSKLIKQSPVLSAAQFRDYVNANGTATQKAMMGTASTDWQKEIYQVAATTDNNLSISGTTHKLPYRFSIGYLNQDGILKTGNLQRTTASLSLTPTVLDNHLKVTLNIKGSQSKNRFANEGAIGSSVGFDPTQPIYSGSNRFGGYYEWLDPASTNGLRSLAPLNPLGLLNQRNDRSTVYRSIGNLQLDYKLHFLPDLHANVNFGYDVSKGTGTVMIPDSAASGYRRYKDPSGNFFGGTNTFYKQQQSNVIFEGYLNYNKDIKSIKSRIDVVAGYSYQDFLTTNFPMPDYTYNKTLIPTSLPLYYIDKPDAKLISFYGRLNYTFNEKYLLTASIRRDGSSRFNPDERWGMFPAAALAWRIKEESFMKDSKLFSDLKLRIGYGKTGQQDVGYFDYISYYNLSNNSASYQFGNTFYNMYRPGGYYYDRKWETTATSNIGFDFGFMNNRITGSIDAYYKKTSDLLNDISQSAGTNFSNRIIANVGNMENKGIEFNINSQLIRKTNLSWDLNFNATYSTYKITKLTIVDDPNYPGVYTGSISGGTGNYIQINSVGFQRAAYYPFQQVYGTNGKPLDGVFVDRNGDGAINDLDRYHYKSAEPKLLLGLNTNVNYKNWTAGIAARANLGNYVYNNVFSGRGTNRSVFGGIGVLYNASTSIFDSGLSGNNDRNSLSDYYIENASFLRLDNINLGYNFARMFNSKATLRLTGNVQNVFVITKYKGLDPEVPGGVDNSFYPRPRTYTIGLNLTL